MRGVRPGTMARTLTSPDGDRQPSCSPRTGRARTAANLAKLPQAATEALRLTHHGLPQALLGTSGWSTARCTDARAASANLHCNIRTGSK